MVYGAIASALIALLALATQVDDLVPHYIDRVEIEELHFDLAGSINQNKIGLLTIQLNQNQGAIYRNQAEIDATKQRGNQPSDNLIREKTYLQKDQDRIRRAIKKLTK